MMSLVGLYALLNTPLRAITTWRVLTLMTATIITNYNMKLLDIFKRKKNAELECLRDAYNTLDKQLQFVTRKNEIAREMNMFDKAFDRFVKFWTGLLCTCSIRTRSEL